MKSRRRMSASVALVTMLGAAAACSKSNSPSGPSSSSANVDISGAWVYISGALNVNWQLTQSGATVTGTSQALEPGSAFYAIGPRGVVTGTVSNGVFTYSDTYTTLGVPNCTEINSGQLTISGTSMTGQNTSKDSCVPAPTMTTVTFRR